VIASVVMLGNIWLKRAAQQEIKEGVEHV
jgi:hypothetical protein